MAHGTRDYGVTAGEAAVYQLTDLGELAARLGSPITHDRRGDVLWWDDFECGTAKWTLSSSGTGSAAAASTAEARNGRRSLLLTAGSDANRSAAARHDNPFPRLSRLGVEVAFMINNLTETLDLEMDLFDGTNQRLFQLRYDDVNNLLRFYNSGGTYTTIASGIDLFAGGTIFHVLKLVINGVTGDYVRALLDNQEFDLDANASISIPDATAAHLRTIIVNTGRAGNNDLVYIDDSIITQNEPANG